MVVSAAFFPAGSGIFAYELSIDFGFDVASRGLSYCVAAAFTSRRSLKKPWRIPSAGMP